MRSNVVIGIKPDVEPSELLELAASVFAPDGCCRLVSLVQVGKSDDEFQRLDDVRAQVDKAAHVLAARGIRVERLVEVAAAALGGELARIAEREGADLLVIGLAKRSLVGKGVARQRRPERHHASKLPGARDSHSARAERGLIRGLDSGGFLDRRAEQRGRPLQEQLMARYVRGSARAVVPVDGTH